MQIGNFFKIRIHYLVKIYSKENLYFFISSLTSLAVLIWVLWLCQFGYDFADEGYYLVWSSNPYHYQSSVSQFGFLYHPLLKLFGENIVYFRRLNIFSTYVLSVLFFQLIISKKFINIGIEKWKTLLLAMSFGTSCFIFLRLWLPTPSYNWLTFQGLLVAAIALLSSESESINKKIYSGFLIGLAGWITFLGKPTSAACLAILVFLYLIINKKYLQIVFAFLSSILLLILSSVLIDGSIFNFINRYLTGLDQVNLMSNYQYSTRVFRLDFINIDNIFILSALWASLIVGILFLIDFYKIKFAHTATPIFFVGALFLVIFFNLHINLANDFQHLLLAFIITFCLLVRFIMAAYKHEVKGSIGMVLVLLFFPFIFVVGTGNNYWWLGGLASIFFVGVGVYFFPINSNMRVNLSPLLLFGLFVQLFSTNILSIGSTAPYYQAIPLQEMNSVATSSRRLNGLKLPHLNAKYVEEVFRILEANNFQPGTPVIDLTGHSPGLLYAINALSLGLPWIQGNYSAVDPKLNFSGSHSLATLALMSEGCNALSRAWVITEPLGVVPIPETVLTGLGANLIDDYTMVGSVNLPKGIGGFAGGVDQFFYKPKDKQAAKKLKACI